MSTIDMNAVREYFYSPVRESGNGEWYPRWWSVVSVDAHDLAVSQHYNSYMGWESEEDEYSRPTHLLVVTMIPVETEDGELVPYSNHVHGIILPVVIEDDTVRPWDGYTVDECLGGGPDLQDEQYALAKQWMVKHGVDESDIVREPVPGL